MGGKLFMYTRQHTTGDTLYRKKSDLPYNLLPLLPPFFLVESDGIGVTSSIRPILRPDLAKALKAA